MYRLTLVGLLALSTLQAAAAAELTLQAGAALTVDGIAGLVRDDLRSRGVGGELRVEVTEPAAPVANRASTAMQVALTDLSYDRRTGRYRARLEAVLASGETATIATHGQVDELVAVAVPSRPIARGEVIAEGDVAVASVPVASLPNDGLRRVEDLVGRQAVRPLAPGRLARASEVATPWQVRRGEDTSVQFSRGALQIVTAAVALDNGRQGEMVRVRNTASGEVRRAQVVGDRRVEVGGDLP